MIQITDKCNIMIIMMMMTLNLNLKKWRDILGPGPGGLGSLRVDRCRCQCIQVAGRCWPPSLPLTVSISIDQIMSASTKGSAMKTKTAALTGKQGTYNLNLSDLKHDLHCGFIELGDSVSVAY